MRYRSRQHRLLRRAPNSSSPGAGRRLPRRVRDRRRGCPLLWWPRRTREGAAPLQTEEEPEPVASFSPSPEPQEEATEQPAGDGGMAAEDDLRATAQALLDKCLATSGKKMTTREKMKTAFKTELVKEIPAAKLGAAIDLLNSILES